MKWGKLLIPAFLIMGLFVAVSPARADLIDISIPSTVPWTNTGIWVEEGDYIEIWASGTVIFADPHSANTTGPDGVAGTSSDQRFVVTDPSIPQNSLIGNIALTSSFTDGAGFFVGSHFEGYVPISGARLNSGYLYLGFNDGAITAGRTSYDSWGFSGDNHGSFSVQIEVTDAPPPVPEPGTMLLLGSALGGLVWRKRKKKFSSAEESPK